MRSRNDRNIRNVTDSPESRKTTYVTLFPFNFLPRGLTRPRFKSASSGDTCLLIMHERDYKSSVYTIDCYPAYRSCAITAVNRSSRARFVAAIPSSRSTLDTAPPIDLIHQSGYLTVPPLIIIKNLCANEYALVFTNTRGVVRETSPAAIHASRSIIKPSLFLTLFSRF